MNKQKTQSSVGSALVNRWLDLNVIIC